MVSRSKLVWQCRRGSFELDTLLTIYLEQRYDQATPSEKAAFQDLLGLEDQSIFHYLSGQAQPDTEDLLHLVTQIRTLISNTNQTNQG
ncbi:MAG: succinate dehydrogenase assembly factor 2 [Gammaproteobacteria bacterium]|nr:succinate dehydrogenase assembly factor 2 [Gammaproteobacteria bacterium]